MAVAWDTLKDFMHRAASVVSQDEWDQLYHEADGMDDATGALAMEHLYLYASSKDDGPPEKKEFAGEKKDGPHAYSCLMANLPPAAAAKALEVGEAVADDHLGEEGREDEPHVTVKFGLHTEDPEEVKAAIGGTRPFKIKLGPLSLFENGEADILKMDVDSPELHALNKKVCDSLEHTDTHPGYKPHMTVAYLKPGEGKNYLKPHAMDGQEVTIDRLVFSDKAGRKTTLRLNVDKGFCPTGPGGGIDNSCGRGSSGSFLVTKDEADEFTKDSALKTPLYRTTNRPDEVPRENTGGHAALAAGVYFGEDVKSIEGYGKAAVVEYRANVRAIKEVAGDAEYDKIKAEALSAAASRRDAHLADVATGKVQIDVSLVAESASQSTAVRDFLESQGFDAIRYKHTVSSDHHDQVVVFRSKNLVAIKTE